MTAFHQRHHRTDRRRPDANPSGDPFLLSHWEHPLSTPGRPLPSPGTPLSPSGDPSPRGGGGGVAKWNWRRKGFKEGEGLKGGFKGDGAAVAREMTWGWKSGCLKEGIKRVRGLKGGGGNLNPSSDEFPDTCRIDAVRVFQETWTQRTVHVKLRKLLTNWYNRWH